MYHFQCEYFLFCRNLFFFGEDSRDACSLVLFSALISSSFQSSRKNDLQFCSLRRISVYGSPDLHTLSQDCLHQTRPLNFKHNLCSVGFTHDSFHTALLQYHSLSGSSFLISKEVTESSKQRRKSCSPQWKIRSCDISPEAASLHWLPVQARIVYKTATLVIQFR